MGMKRPETGNGNELLEQDFVVCLISEGKMTKYETLGNTTSRVDVGYRDCNGTPLNVGDLLRFSNNHYYKCVETSRGLGLKCMSCRLPIILIDGISIDHILCSAIKISGGK